MLKTIFLIITTIVFSITTIVLANNNSLFPIRVTAEQLTNKAKAEVECLADNIFFEAGYEPIEGQRAVGIVTLNRVRSGAFENTICSVVKERNLRTCQFSWYCQDRERTMAYNKERLFSNEQKNTYEKVYIVALDLYVNSHTIKDNTGGALFYHADYVNPKWNHLNRTVKIGSHIFYRHGEKYAHQYDAKIKSRIENERQFVAFVLPSDGGY